MADNIDKRVTPVRADLAASHLRGQVDAPRFADGMTASIRVGRASLRARPAADAPQDSELLYGEGFTVYDRADGWAWGQADRDGYVGYLREDQLGPYVPAEVRVSALMAPLFPAPDLKTPVRELLPMGSAVPVRAADGDYVQIGDDAFLHRRHLSPETATDFVSVAERFLGAPYVWGGRSVAGLDCSGLIQVSLEAVGKSAPRDTDMQEAALGTPVAMADRRGDLVFWKGHVGVMLDATRLLHANAFHMAVAAEPLADAVARIEQAAGPVRSVKRL